MKFEWSADLELGIPEIDEDHRLIIEFAQKLLNYYHNNSPSFIIERAISDFNMIFSLHLLKEENLMTKISYPYLKSHMIEHAAMTQILTNFLDNRQSDDSSCLNIAFFVLQWLNSHFAGADRLLANYITSKYTGHHDQNIHNAGKVFTL